MQTDDEEAYCQQGHRRWWPGPLRGEDGAKLVESSRARQRKGKGDAVEEERARKRPKQKCLNAASAPAALDRRMPVRT